MSVTNVAIIGKIPGYGNVLDNGNVFGKILLRDITYIDLIPATYSINTGMFGVSDGNISDFYNYASGKNAGNILTIYKNIISNLGDYAEKQFGNALNGLPGLSESTKAFYILKATEITKIWKNTSSVRILGANDSTFTETISNTFMNNDSGSNIVNNATRLTDRALPSINKALGTDSVIGKFQNLGYGNALDALTAASTSSGLVSLLSGKILGVQFATPNTWTSSSYNSTLSIFIKLASPSGDPLSIYKNITLPILTMMSTGSPITVNGVTYAMPLIWDVRAYGITHFKIGAVAAMTISRGSYETVFNSAKQPLLVDVRLTIVPLMQDFAVQYTGGADKVLTKYLNDAVKTIKVTSKDIKTTTSSLIPDMIADAYDGLTTKFDEISSSLHNSIASVSYDKNTPGLYGSNGLGVQSPGDEVDGLMGISYGGPGKDSTNDFMKLDKYSKPNDYVTGFANSYTFKI